MKRSMIGPLAIICTVILLSVFQSHSAEINQKQLDVAIKAQSGMYNGYTYAALKAVDSTKNLKKYHATTEAKHLFTDKSLVDAIHHTTENGDLAPKAANYATTIAKSLFTGKSLTDTAYLTYETVDKVPSEALKDCSQDTHMTEVLEWDASGIYPIITRDDIQRAFSYADQIKNNQKINIPVRMIVPCCIIAQYLAFEPHIKTQFSHAYFMHQDEINLNEYFNETTLNMGNTNHIKKYQSDFIAKLLTDLPSFEQVTLNENEIRALMSNVSHSPGTLDLRPQHTHIVLHRTDNIEQVFKNLSTAIKNNVVEIDLSNHQIIELDIRRFKRIFPNLAAINMHNNDISNLDDKFFSSLPRDFTVILTNNPIRKITTNNHPRSNCTLIVSHGTIAEIENKLYKVLEPNSSRIKAGQKLSSLAVHNPRKIKLIGEYVINGSLVMALVTLPILVEVIPIAYAIKRFDISVNSKALAFCTAGLNYLALVAIMAFNPGNLGNKFDQYISRLADRIYNRSIFNTLETNLLNKEFIWQSNTVTVV